MGWKRGTSWYPNQWLLWSSIFFFYLSKPSNRVCSVHSFSIPAFPRKMRGISRKSVNRILTILTPQKEKFIAKQCLAIKLWYLEPWHRIRCSLIWRKKYAARMIGCQAIAWFTKCDTCVTGCEQNSDNLDSTLKKSFLSHATILRAWNESVYPPRSDPCNQQKKIA